MTDIRDIPFPYVLSSTRYGPVALAGVSEDRLLLSGRNNAGSPVQHFADSIAASDDEQFVQTASDVIYMSAHASNNATSDFHWQADACYYEARRREKPELYQAAYDWARGIAGL